MVLKYDLWYNANDKQKGNIMADMQNGENILNKIMVLSDGSVVYQLTTPEALRFEDKNLHTNTASAQSRIKDMMANKIALYSIHDADGKTGGILEIDGNNVESYIGQSGNKPDHKFMLAGREFIQKAGFNMGFRGKEFGFVSIDGKNYDVFKLPNKLTVRYGMDLHDMNLEKLPDLRQWEIYGDFNCSDNQLTNLEGMPKQIHGNFDARNNELTSLKGAPEKVDGDFDCRNNKSLTNIDDKPAQIGGNFMHDNLASRQKNKTEIFKSGQDTILKKVQANYDIINRGNQNN